MESITKQLVNIGHGMSREIAADEPAVAKLLVELSSALDVQYERGNALEARCAALAAENAGLKNAAEFATADDMWEELGGNVMRYQYQEWYADRLKSSMKTPATDAFLAEVRAQARNEGINYAASRLAAAFSHGFVDKPLAEVYDVVRMILDTKEELANSTLPAEDGLSGEYAEEFIENSTVELRKGVQS